MDIDTDVTCQEVENCSDVVVEEIDELIDDGTLGKRNSRSPCSPVSVNQKPAEPELELPPSPLKVRRDFGNISPISELLDHDDIDITSRDDEESAGKITPEPVQSVRQSFPRISDGRSSPILAYSPSLVKSPSTIKTITSTSPSSSGGGVGKRPRNIARMLDNISDHSSSEDDVNSVGVMMAKFSV